MSALGHLNNLSLLDELTDSGTSAGTVDLQAVHNGVNGDELHLWMIADIIGANLGDFSKQLVVISLLEVHLVIDGISGLTLAPFLAINTRISSAIPSFRWRTIKTLDDHPHRIETTSYVQINLP